MKYFLKAITTNNRDLKTSIYLGFEQDLAYLFNVPDGFQRMALNQKMKFNKVRYIFLSSLHPDHYAGFPGFYLSAREASQADLQSFRVTVFGPKGIKSLIKQGYTFYSNLNQLEIFDYSNMNAPQSFTTGDGKNFEFVPYDYQKPQPAVLEASLGFEGKQEEEKKQQSPRLSSGSFTEEREQNKDYPGISPTQTFSDRNVTVIPVKLASTNQRDMGCYSYICIPKQIRAKMIPKKAIQLGCDPRVHFKLLTEG